MKTKDITAFIIGGGKSKRFGQDKLLYKYKGIILIEHVIIVLKKVFDDIIIISNNKDKLSFLGLSIVPDIIPDLGPLGGIYTALDYSETHKIFCFAGDLPNLNAELIKYMISISSGYDIVAPYINGYYEVLYTIYTKNCLKFIENIISSGDYKIIHLFKYCNLRKVYEDEIIKFIKPEIAFKNINSKKDME